MDSNKSVGAEEAVQSPIFTEANKLRDQLTVVVKNTEILATRLSQIMSDPPPPNKSPDDEEVTSTVTCEVSQHFRESANRAADVASLLQNMIDRCQL